MKTWKNAMTTRERIRAVVRREPTDHLPLCFTAICHGVIGFLYERLPDPIKQAEFLMNLGVDAGVTITAPAHSLKGLEIKAWREDPPGERYPVLHKEYRTPRGTLKQVVRKTEDYGNDVRLFADHNVPASRSMTYLVESEENLDALEYLLRTPDDEDCGDSAKRQSLQGVLRCAWDLSVRVSGRSGRSVDLVVRRGAQRHGFVERSRLHGTLCRHHRQVEPRAAGPLAGDRRGHHCAARLVREHGFLVPDLVPPIPARALEGRHRIGPPGRGAVHLRDEFRRHAAAG